MDSQEKPTWDEAGDRTKTAKEKKPKGISSVMANEQEIVQDLKSVNS
jgi:hypothetical protein